MKTRRDESLRERGDLSDLFASSLVLIRGDKRSEFQRYTLRNALQLFVENRLAAVVAGSPGNVRAEDVCKLLSLPVENVLPRYAHHNLRTEYEAVYMGELFGLPSRAWKDNSKTKTARVCRELFGEWGLPFDLDPNSVGWVPPYAEDPAVVHAWDMRLHETVSKETCDQEGGCETVGEFILRFAGWAPQSMRRFNFWGFEKLGLRSAMFVPASWTPPARDPKGCAGYGWTH